MKRDYSKAEQPTAEVEQKMLYAERSSLDALLLDPKCAPIHNLLRGRSNAVKRYFDADTQDAKKMFADYFESVNKEIIAYLGL